MDIKLIAILGLGAYILYQKKISATSLAKDAAKTITDAAPALNKIVTGELPGSTEKEFLTKENYPASGPDIFNQAHTLGPESLEWSYEGNRYYPVGSQHI